MTSLSTASHSRPRRSFHVIATGVALAALAVPIASSAADRKVDGVRAEIKRGALEVKGGDQDNAVALRLKAGDPNRVQVDVGDDGSADFSFARGDLSAINVKMGDGVDSVRIDDANGAFTDAVPTTIAGGDGDDSLNGGEGPETFRGGAGNDTVDAGGATTPPPSARGTTPSAGIRARPATSSRARKAPTGCCSTAPRRARPSR